MVTNLAGVSHRVGIANAPVQMLYRGGKYLLALETHLACEFLGLQNCLWSCGMNVSRLGNAYDHHGVWPRVTMSLDVLFGSPTGLHDWYAKVVAWWALVLC